MKKNLEKAEKQQFQMVDLSQTSHSTRECQTESAPEYVPEQKKPAVTKPQMFKQWFKSQRN